MNCNVYFILQFPIVQTRERKKRVLFLSKLGVNVSPVTKSIKNYWYLKYLKKNKMSATLHKLELYYVSFLYTVNEKVPECFSSSFVRTFFIFFSESIFQRREILLKLVDFWFWLLAWEYPTYDQLNNAMENLSNSIVYTYTTNLCWIIAGALLME